MQNADRAVLKQHGKSLELRLVSGGQFEVISAEQEPPEMRNAGMKQVIAQWLGAVGSVRIEVEARR